MGYFPRLQLQPRLRMSGAIPLLPPCDFLAWRTAFPLYLYFTFMPKEAVSGTSQTYTTSWHIALLLITQKKSHIFNILGYICGNCCLLGYDAV